MPTLLTYSLFFLGLYPQQNRNGDLYGQICAGLVMIIFIAIIVLQLRKQKPRQNELEHFAALEGYSFHADGHQLSQQIRGQNYEIFREMGIPAVSNTLNINQDQYDITFFDTARMGKAGKIPLKSLEFLSGVLLQTEMEAEISFSIKPKKGSDRFMQGLGLSGITFDHPEFSKKYIAEGYDEDNIRAALNPAVLDWIASQTDNLVIEGRPNQMILYYENRQVKPEEIKDFIQKAVHLLELTGLPKRYEDLMKKGEAPMQGG